jgi:hypothetical protein
MRAGMYGQEDMMIYSVPVWFFSETDTRTLTFQFMQNAVAWLWYANSFHLFYALSVDKVHDPFSFIHSFVTNANNPAHTSR